MENHFALTLLFWVIAAAHTVLYGQAYPTESLEKLSEAQLDSTSELYFRGKIRIWHSSWLKDEDGNTTPGYSLVRLTEHTIADRGYEQLSLKWQQPFRSDLTPDVDYSRTTRDSTITATGNDLGARATVLPSKGYSGKKTSLHRVFNNLLAYFISSEFDSTLRGMTWNSLGPTNVSLGDDFFAGPSGANRQIEQSTVCVTAATNTADPRWQRIEAHAICLNGIPDDIQSSAYTIDLSNGSSFPFVPAALDIATKTDGGRRPEWVGRTEASYRVLQWQIPTLSTPPSETITYLLPRLAVLDEIVYRPKQPTKSYHRLQLVLIDVEPDSKQELELSWENLLPNMRIMDVATGRPRVNRITERDECAAWQFLVRMKLLCPDFHDLLTSDLRKRYSHHFESVLSPSRGLPDIGPPIGATKHGGSFRLMKRDPIFNTEVNSRIDITDFLQPAKSPPLPPLLELIGDIRKNDNKSEMVTRPGRQGYEPVTREQQSRAKFRLSIFYTAIGMLTALALGLLFIVRHRMSHLERSVGVLVFCISLPWNVVPKASAQATTDKVGHSESSLSNIDEVRKAIGLHCQSLVGAFPAMQEELLWQAVVSKHLEIRDRISPSNSQCISIQPRQLFNILNDYYGVLPFLESPQKTLPSRSTLEAVLMRRQGNCYSLSFEYFLHCRLANINMKMLAVPNHVMLCKASNLDVSRPNGMKLIEVYDPSTKRWLSARQVAHIDINPHSVLNESQVAAVAAFNTGTLLCQSQDYARGIPLLETALRLKFPFPQGIKNLCLAYASQHNNDAVIRVVETHLRDWRLDIQEDADPYRASDNTIADAVWDTQKIFFEALIRSGRFEDARDAARRILTEDPRETDFKLYLLYFELKKSLANDR